MWMDKQPGASATAATSSFAPQYEKAAAVTSVQGFPRPNGRIRSKDFMTFNLKRGTIRASAPLETAARERRGEVDSCGDRLRHVSRGFACVSLGTPLEAFGKCLQTGRRLLAHECDPF
jgi:hypothetical protein